MSQRSWHASLDISPRLLDFTQRSIVARQARRSATAKGDPVFAGPLQAASVTTKLQTANFSPLLRRAWKIKRLSHMRTIVSSKEALRAMLFDVRF
ncbi:hypothetical protein ASC78_23145 [Variovorax sp. Root318D1]|nr:hypothetical protein ASC78_23145 [Variovorax sp. Root318D1]